MWRVHSLQIVSPIVYKTKKKKIDVAIGSRYHPPCIDMTVDEAKKVEHFFCQSCSSAKVNKETSHGGSEESELKVCRCPKVRIGQSFHFFNDIFWSVDKFYSVSVLLSWNSSNFCTLWFEIWLAFELYLPQAWLNYMHSRSNFALGLIVREPTNYPLITCLTRTNITSHHLRVECHIFCTL